MSKCHQQCLLAWKLCYVHSFSPHRTCLWNNRDITIRNKSLFFPRWFQNNINCILCLFDDSGNILSYEQFMSYHSFQTPPKEFNKVIKAISPGLIHLVKCHSLFKPRTSVVTRSTLLLEGVDLLDKTCNNRHVRQVFQFKKKMYPRGKFYWRSLVDDIDLKRSWLLPGKYCISNKAKETHFT